MSGKRNARSPPGPKTSSGEPSLSAPGQPLTRPIVNLLGDSSDMELGTPRASADMAELEMDSSRKSCDMDLSSSADFTGAHNLRLQASATASETAFDDSIGHIEDIIMDEEFQMLQRDFQERYYHEFEDSEENKLCYTDIHKEYCDQIESHLIEELAQRQKNFDVERFLEELTKRQEHLEGEVFEILLTFSDFAAFKETMLDYKRDKDGEVVDLSDGLTVTPLSEPSTPTPGVGPRAPFSSATDSRPKTKK